MNQMICQCLAVTVCNCVSVSYCEIAAGFVLYARCAYHFKKELVSLIKFTGCFYTPCKVWQKFPQKKYPDFISVVFNGGSFI